jgi:quercetin dioxygenase-like cupin family protein
LLYIDKYRRNLTVTEKSITAYEDLQFSPLADGSPVEVAVLWGNPEIGPAAVMVRFPEGYQEPWHSHSTTYHSVLIKGEFQTRSKDTGAAESEVLGPGAYVVQPGGAVHSEVNAGSCELVALVYFDGPVDFTLDE